MYVHVCVCVCVADTYFRSKTKGVKKKNDSMYTSPLLVFLFA